MNDVTEHPTKAGWQHDLYDLLSERRRQPFGDHARHRVDTAAGRIWHDQRDGARRVVIGERWCGECDQSGNELKQLRHQRALIHKTAGTACAAMVRDAVLASADRSSL